MSEKKIRPDQLRSRLWFNNPDDTEMTALIPSAIWITA